MDSGEIRLFRINSDIGRKPPCTSNLTLCDPFPLSSKCGVWTAIGTVNLRGGETGVSDLPGDAIATRSVPTVLQHSAPAECLPPSFLENHPVL